MVKSTATPRVSNREATALKAALVWQMDLQ